MDSCLPVARPVLQTKPVAEADRALLLSIVTPTLETHAARTGSDPSQAFEVPIADAVDVPIAGAVLRIPIARPDPVFVTPPQGEHRGTIELMLSNMKRRPADLEDDVQPVRQAQCRQSLAAQFDHAVREGAAAELEGIASALEEARLSMPDEDSARLLGRLVELIGMMATDVLTGDPPAPHAMSPITSTLRGVVDLLGRPTLHEVLQDTLCVVSAHAHELRGLRPSPEFTRHPLGLLLSCRRLARAGVVPASPTAQTHGVDAQPPPVEQPGPLDGRLMSLLQCLVDATGVGSGPSQEGLASDLIALAGATLGRIAGDVVAAGGQIPELASLASALLPRLCKVQEYIMRLPPGFTEEPLARLQAISTEARDEARLEQIDARCGPVVQNACLAMERAGGALGLLSDACARLAVAGIDPPELKGFAENDFAELWRALQWTSDAMRAISTTVAVVKGALKSLDLGIHAMERDPSSPEEAAHLLGGVMESSLLAVRTVARLVKPGRTTLLSRLMDSAAYVTESSSETRAALDALACEPRA